MVLSDAKILIVDDEPDLIDLHVEWFLQAGCKSVRTAENGVAALAALAEGPVDLLLTDVLMPEMDGVSLVRHLAQRGGRTPSIVLISGFVDVDKREMYALGVEAFLTKPFRRKELFGTLENILADRSSLWHTPLPRAPRQSIVLQVDQIDEATNWRSLQLGSGGFSVWEDGTVGLGNIVFQCDIASHQQQISGQGYVRWKSHGERRIGVEIAFIEEPGRTWLLGEIKARNPRSFIPSG